MTYAKKQAIDQEMFNALTTYGALKFGSLEDYKKKLDQLKILNDEEALKNPDV